MAKKEVAKEVTVSSEEINTTTETTEKKWFLSGFFEFLQQYSIIGLAIGIVIGDASKNMVNALVEGLITPFIGLFLPSNQSLQNFTTTIRGQQFQIGQIVMNSISFIIILFIIFFIIKIILRRDDLLKK